MPAEWEPHSGVWLAWPHNLTYWSEREIGELETLYGSMVRALAGGETIEILVNDGDRAKAVAQKLRKDDIPLDRVNFHVIPTDDVWVRDYGPNFLVSESTDEKTAFNQWQFNAWGEKYAMPRDGRVAAALSAKLGIRTFRPGLVLEGGAIEVNGKGTCITTEQCLLNKNRNGGRLGRAEIEGYLRDYLGVEKIIWCQSGLEGDDTDGHIDNLARFVNANTVLCAFEEDVSDINHENLKNNYDILRQATDQDGGKLNVIRLPMPGNVSDGNARLPASYANFYIGNKAVLVPAYDGPNDQAAAELIGSFFPRRDIVGIPSRALIAGLGGIHCVTQQQPAPFSGIGDDPETSVKGLS